MTFWLAVKLPHPASQSSAPLSRVPGEGKFEMIYLFDEEKGEVFDM